MGFPRLPPVHSRSWILAALAGVLAAGAAIWFWLPPLPLFLAYGRDDLWIPRWLPALAIPAGAGLLAAWALPRRRERWRPAALALLLVLPLLQGGLLAPMLAWRSHTLRRPGPGAASQRQYRPLPARGPDWPDPREGLRLDLGGGVRMLMATTCHVDAQGRTLPRATAGPAPTEPVADSLRKPTDRGLANLAAFTRALGWLRFFHPADEASGADWPRLAAQGLAQVEDAGDPAALAQRLQAWFAPHAPTVRFVPAGSPEPPPPPAPPEARGLVRWRHCAPGCGADPAAADRGPMVGPPGRGTRLAGVAWAWTTLQHFHPWLEGTDWSGRLPGALAEAAQAADADAYLAALRRLTAALGDGHILVSRSGVDDQAQPPLALVLVDGEARVARRWGEAQAIPPGSRILAVDGEPVAARSRRLAGLIAAGTDGWARARLALDLLAGQRDAPLMVRFQEPAGAVAAVRLRRTESLFAVLAPGAAALARPRPGIGYADLSRCTDADWPGLLRLLRESEGMVFDLRGYPGDFDLCLKVLAHLAGRPLWSPRWLLPEFTRPDRQGVAWDPWHRWPLERQGPRAGGRVAFLAGGGSISAAETLLAMVAHYRLGTVVGEPTAGCNGDVNLTALPGGLEMTWTSLRVLNHDGSRLQGVGIAPAVPVRPSARGLAQGRDEVLERALEWLQAASP